MDRSRDAGAPGLHGGERVEIAGGLDAALVRWVADARVEEAARRRIREHWLRVQAEESATLSGTLVELAELSTTIVVAVAGHRVRGTVAGVGADFVAVRAPGLGGGDVLIRTGAIDAVSTAASGGAASGGSTVPGDAGGQILEVTLGAILGPVARERPEVRIRTTAGTDVRGRLRAAGTDVVPVLLHGDRADTAWIPLASIAVVTIDV
jgi:hypothetical protein